MTSMWVYAVKQADVLRLLATRSNYSTHVRCMTLALLDDGLGGLKRAVDDVQERDHA